MTTNQNSPLLAQAQTLLADGKAEEVVVLNTEQQSNGLFAYMVVATARSARHAAALTNRLRRDLKAAGGGEILIETSAASEWTLMDCGELVVHIMLPAAREYYQLESLWSMRPRGERPMAADSAAADTNRETDD